MVAAAVAVVFAAVDVFATRVIMATCRRLLGFLTIPPKAAAADFAAAKWRDMRA